MAEEIKKSYNPFKMWGSWIGAILGPFMGLLTTEFVVCKILNLCTGGDFAGFGLAIIFSLTLYPILGFLIGWGVHSLIRRNKNTE